MASALGRFGLVDQFGLTELFRDAVLPSEAAITRVLNQYVEALPSGVPASLIAQIILAETREELAEPLPKRLTEEDLRSLKRLPSGKRAAYNYHKQVYFILRECFWPQLVNGVLEQPLHVGLKKIDIVFENAASGGFFAGLTRVHGIPAQYVPFECKNYSADPGNPEFDQIANRLAPQRGMFGVIVCRRIDERSKALQRRNRLMHEDKKYIVILEDEDVEAMVRSYLGEDAKSAEETLTGKLRELLFS